MSDPDITIPYAKAYGVDNVRAQEALRLAAVVCLDQVMSGDATAGDFYSVLENVGEKEWIVALTIVGWKLAQPTEMSLTNTLEEFACWHIYTYARDVIPDLWDEPELDFGAFLDMAFDDLDFQARLDGEPGTEAEVKSWLQSFGRETYGVPHPILVDDGPWMGRRVD